ncbi:hypothetical protein WJX72_009280 [[Myrmecia] bisecta]|uniref:Uncharacterized protein n=1 Tax=[Myrmecia] bisecta TaxID=41462 RepID=A0AAW1QSB0_9CHLO
MASTGGHLLRKKCATSRRPGQRLGAVRLNSSGDSVWEAPGDHACQSAQDHAGSTWVLESQGCTGQPRQPSNADHPVTASAGLSMPCASQVASSPVKQAGGPWNLMQKTLMRLADGAAEPPGRPPSSPASPLFDVSVLDKGLDAIIAVKHAAIGVATTLDTAIEQLVDSWTSPQHAPTASRAPCTNLAREKQAQPCKQGPDSRTVYNTGKPGALPMQLQPDQAAASPAKEPLTALQPVHVPCSHNMRPRRQANAPIEPAGKENNPRTSSGQGLDGKQAQGVNRPPKSKRQEQDLSTLKAALDKVQKDLRYTSSKCNALSHENELLREKVQAVPEQDPLAEQVRAQLQALLAEKAKLAQENARLARENFGLQELLEYTMQQQQGEAGEEFADDWEVGCDHAEAGPKEKHDYPVTTTTTPTRTCSP